ncbi:MAG: PCI domain-containing protein [Candidatus Sigynarchaeota archaeon]
MGKERKYDKYKYTLAYRRVTTSIGCTIGLGILWIFIEALWGGLGYFFWIDTLLYMAMYANIPFGIMLGIMIGMMIKRIRDFKRKVADGSIDKDLTSTVYFPAGPSKVMSVLQSMGERAGRPLTLEEQKIKGLIQMYPKITLAALAAKAGVPEDQIEDKLSMLLSEGVIRGHVDPGTEEFISGMIDTTRVKPVDDAVFDCPHCGAVMKSAPVKGTSVRCASCGNLIVVH